MHQSVMEWGALHTEAFKYDPVIEWGSNSSNGSFRPLFFGPYHGVDLTEGPGVDQFPRDLENPEHILPTTIDTVLVCTEVLEHVYRPWLALANLRASGAGLLFLTCRGYDERGCWPVHEHPVDLWRFSADGLSTILHDAGWRVQSIDADPEGPGWLVVAT
jgi:hypothetical protein